MVIVSVLPVKLAVKSVVSFCASGRLGKVRNLTLSELVLQVLTIQRNLDKSGERLSNIVVMGIGEPFDNYENTRLFTGCQLSKRT